MWALGAYISYSNIKQIGSKAHIIFIPRFVTNRNSNLWPFNHESGTLTAELSLPELSPPFSSHAHLEAALSWQRKAEWWGGAEECTIKSKLHRNTVTLPDSFIFQPVHPRKDNGHVWSCLPQPIELLAKGTDLSFAQPHAGQGKGRGVTGGVAGWEGQVKGQGAKVTQVKWPCPALTCTKHGK